MPWGCKVAAANSPLPSVRKGVEQYNDIGIGSDQVVLGLPWYGWRYKCVDGSDFNTPCTLKSTSDWYGDVAFQEVLENQVAAMTSHNSSLVLDSASSTKFFTYVDEEDGTIMQQWMDDEETLATKYALKEEFKLRGVGFWTKDCVKEGGKFDDMWNAVPDY